MDPVVFIVIISVLGPIIGSIIDGLVKSRISPPLVGGD